MLAKTKLQVLVPRLSFTRQLSVTRISLNTKQHTQIPPINTNISSQSKSNSNRSTWTSAALFLFGSLVGASYVSYKVAGNPPSFLFPQSSITPLNEVIPPQYGDPTEAIAEITKLLGPEKVTNTKSDLDQHSDTYWSTHHATASQRPDLVVFPETTEEVSQVLKICHKFKVPVVPFTGGTSLEGHFIPTRQGICVDLTRMQNIVKLHKDDLDVVVQSAVGWEDLRDYLDDYGLMFGPDPGPGACIGGMIGTSCSGTNAARYGTMRENVLGLTVVLADGTIIKTKQRPRKSSAGYNLTGLFIGSEGTLAWNCR
ncbi:unnamed protein product [Ambrosiozyma monospora]|uniref:Unnamed protein product n=1 Tax=Ambrosiozyma monospora TaxID=43982 RepID=A0ACB5U3A6_AMBMO|nr:unnamed protein product [Ambrosiozyma monospora]